jgi:hypothetical protein
MSWETWVKETPRSAQPSRITAVKERKKRKPASEACKKYRDQLAYCSELGGKEQFFDGEWVFHSKGKVGGKGHHWFVEEVQNQTTTMTTGHGLP